MARQLYAEIASIEEQHVTQYESIIDPNESWLEKWLLHEANEVYNYYGCVQQESNSRIKAIWERCLDYELGHLHVVKELFKRYERRDPAEILPAVLPEPIRFESQREFVRKVLNQEVDLRARGKRFREQIGRGESDAGISRTYELVGFAIRNGGSGLSMVPGNRARPRHSTHVYGVRPGNRDLALGVFGYFTWR